MESIEELNIRSNNGIPPASTKRCHVASSFWLLSLTRRITLSHRSIASRPKVSARSPSPARRSTPAASTTNDPNLGPMDSLSRACKDAFKRGGLDVGSSSARSDGITPNSRAASRQAPFSARLPMATAAMRQSSLFSSAKRFTMTSKPPLSWILNSVCSSKLRLETAVAAATRRRGSSATRRLSAMVRTPPHSCTALRPLSSSQTAATASIAAACSSAFAPVELSASSRSGTPPSRSIAARFSALSAVIRTSRLSAA
mmetsp:Transcript_5194/g.15868  ORF Transcript_5194/g.15868 Transcript_5194/m.15868 type:complete len:257 (+) Transcript_5194:1073-1843(+)